MSSEKPHAPGSTPTEKKNDICGGRLEKLRNVGPPTLWAPFGPLPFGLPPFGLPSKGAPPSGTTPFGPRLSPEYYLPWFSTFLCLLSLLIVQLFPMFPFFLFRVFLCCYSLFFLCFLSAQIDQILVVKIGLAKVGRGPLGPCTRETLFARYGVCQGSTPKRGFGF